MISSSEDLYSDSSSFLDDFDAAIRDVCTGGEDSSHRRADLERRYLSTPAPNIIRWCLDKEYCNSPSLIGTIDPENGMPLPGYWRSYQVIRDTFQLRCPICNRGGTEDGEPGDCWGKSRAELEAEHLLEWNSTHNEDACPKCDTTRSEFEEDGLLKPVNQLHLVCGQRSGKSITGALIGTYVEHRLITLALAHPNGLRGYLGLTVDDPFEMTFLASNETQAQDTIWAKYLAFRRGSPWFQRFTTWVKDEEETQNTPPGMKKWVYVESNKKITNEHPDLFLIVNSLNSNSSGLRGRTRVFGGLDEIAYMLDGDSRMGADEIFRSIDNSLQTVRSRTKRVGGLPWLGLMCSVSSPRSRDDKSMRLLREAPGIDGMLAYHYATWDFNPYEPRENFDDMFAKDPIGAKRDFAAQPPNTAHPLIPDINRWRDLVVTEDLAPTAWFDYRMFEESGHEYMGIKLADAKLQMGGSPRFLAFDAGKNFDAFAGACGHGEVWVDEDTGVQRTVTVIDWVVRILPEQGTEVYYDDVFGLVKGINRKQPIQRVEFDHWNATQLIQQIRRIQPIRAEEVNVKDEQYRRFRADAYAGLVKMLPPAAQDVDAEGKWIVDPPSMAAESCALYEIESLEEDPDTRKVFNPNKGKRRGWNSNDVAEVIVHVHTMVQGAGYTKKDDDRSRRAARKRSEGDAHDFISRGGGGVYNPSRSGGAIRNWKKGGPSGRGW